MFALVGAVLLLAALVGFVRKRATLARYHRTTGAVVGHRVRHTVRKGRRRTFHHPLVQFDAGGRACVHESRVSTSQPRRELGAPVPVLYDPANPDEACIDEVSEKYFVVLLLGAIGLVFSCVGVGLLVRGE